MATKPKERKPKSPHSTHSAPQIEKENSLGKPIAITLKTLVDACEHAAKVGDDHQLISQITINIARFYKTHVDAVLAGIEEKDVKIAKAMSESYEIVIEMPLDQPRVIKVRAKWLPSLVPRINPDLPDFVAYVEPLPAGYPEVRYQGRPVTNRLVTEMIYDITKPPTDQLKRFRVESVSLVGQYCIPSLDQPGKEAESA